MTVHRRVEKLGMVVEVLTAQSTAALDRYLADKQLDVKAADINALNPYLEGEYTLICGWPADPKTPLTARAVRVDFPTPAIYYPLRPTRVYESTVDTAIYVRGWARPQPGMDLPGLRCRYVRGKVSDLHLAETFETDIHAPFPRTELDRLEEVPLTRVDLTPLPRGWTQDLLLEPGVPAAVAAAERINAVGAGGTWLLSVLLGVVLAAWLPFAVVPPGQRKGSDWLWASWVGAGIGLSIYASAFLLYGWLRDRKLTDPAATMGPVTRGSLAYLGVAVPVLGFVILVGALARGPRWTACPSSPGWPCWPCWAARSPCRWRRSRCCTAPPGTGPGG